MRMFTGSWLVRALAALALVCAGSTAQAGITVVATGDSLTNGYAGSNAWRLQGSFDAAGYAATVRTVASGGCAIDRYLGQVIDPHTGTYRDFAGEVLAADPDAILFMLGTNDVYRWWNVPTAFDQYTAGVSQVLDRFAAAVNGRGEAPLVIFSTLPPILRDAGNPGTQGYFAGQRVVDSFNPWIRQQAQSRGLVLMDTYQWITAQPNWQDFYNDGVHLYGNNSLGYYLLADAFRDTTIAAIPEPATLTLLAAGLLLIRRRNLKS